MTLYYHHEETNEEKEEGEVCETPGVVDIGVYTKASHRKFIVVYDNGEIQYENIETFFFTLKKKTKMLFV